MAAKKITTTIIEALNLTFSSFGTETIRQNTQEDGNQENIKIRINQGPKLKKNRRNNQSTIPKNTKRKKKTKQKARNERQTESPFSRRKKKNPVKP